MMSVCSLVVVDVATDFDAGRCVSCDASCCH